MLLVQGEITHKKKKRQSVLFKDIYAVYKTKVATGLE